MDNGKTSKINPREVVLDILVDIYKEKDYSNVVLQDTLRKYQYLSKTDRAFITRLCEGCIEYEIHLDYIINAYSKTKINKCKNLIKALLRMGVYQIKFMDGIPNSAACNESVKLAKKRGFASLSGFVNGVLRNVERNIDKVIFPDEKTEPVKAISVMYSVPEWLVAEIIDWYGIERTKAILTASFNDRPTTIRCNLSKISLEELKEKLKVENIHVEEGNYSNKALHISEYNYLNRIEEFQKGSFTVQDESSIIAGIIAAPKKNDFIIDICAAPGGKSIHAADIIENQGRILSRDVSERKIELIKENIEKCGFTCIETEIYNGRETDEKLIEKADILLADVPCSGLGIMGKKNDIKYKLSKNQLEELVNLQREIISASIKYVKKGGVLIYSTCTINPKENIENIKWIEKNYDFKLESIDEYIDDKLKSNTTAMGYLAFVPDTHKCDGFFVARLRKEK